MNITRRVARLFPRPVRLWLYLVGVAAFGVLFVYSVVNLEQAAAWLGLISAVLGIGETGMAALNTRKPRLAEGGIVSAGQPYLLDGEEASGKEE